MRKLKPILKYLKNSFIMKKVVLFLLSAVILIGCTQTDDLFENESDNSLSENIDCENLNQVRAIKLAQRFFDDADLSRSGDRVPASINYVLRKHMSRAANSDTIAYIINYADNQGFAIMLNSEKVRYPVAFSESGSFINPNECVTENFVQNLESYVDNIEITQPDSVVIPGFDKVYRQVGPMLKVHPHQLDPWNKYVIVDHPGCAVGCGPLALTNIMLHSKDKFTYRGETVYAHAIIDAIHDHHKPITPGNLGSTDAPDNTNITYPGDFYDVYYTFDQGMDLYERMLYNVGIDMHATYVPITQGEDGKTYGGTSATPSSIIPVLNACGFELLSGQSTKGYNFTDVFNYINESNIVFLFGSVPKESTGHFWIGDGCKYAVDKKSGKPILPLRWIHCDWGWGGGQNGYFTGDVFSLKAANDSTVDYHMISYAAIKNESTLNK